MHQWADDGNWAGRGFGATPVGARQLAGVSSFGDTEPLRLPFDLQRSPLVLITVAAIAVVAVATGAAFAPLVGVGVLLALALALAVALNERLGLLLLVILVPITSGLGHGVPVPGFRVSELLIAGVSAILLVSARRTVPWGAFDWLALLYAVSTFALGSYDLLHRAAPFSGGDFGLLAGPFQFLLLYRAIAITATGEATKRLVVRCVLLASIPVGILALGQQFNAPGFRSLITTLTGNDIYAANAGAGARATGPFPHWHNLGGYLFMVLLVMFAVLIRRVPGVLPKPVLLGVAALDIAALIQTLSLAPIFGVVAGGLILGFWLGGAARITAALAVAVIVAALVFGPRLQARYSEEFKQAPGTERSALVPSTVQYRYDLWTNQLLPQLHGRWITGYGPDLPPQLQNFPFTESLYINLLFRGGVVLLAIWTVMAAALGVRAARSASDADPLQQALGAALATALLMLLFMQFLEAYFVDSGTPHVLWIVAGLLSFGGIRSAAARPRAARAA